MVSDSETGTAQEETTYNVFRHSALRYLGYANEVGESFRYQYPKLVGPSYILAFGYVFADAMNSGYVAYQKDNRTTERMSPSASVPLTSIVSTVDTLIWQTLASVLIPGATINGIVRVARFAVSRTPAAIPVTISTWGPTAVGLGSIPVIIHPIDHGVDIFMDSTYRRIDFDGLYS